MRRNKMQALMLLVGFYFVFIYSCFVGANEESSDKKNLQQENKKPEMILPGDYKEEMKNSADNKQLTEYFQDQYNSPLSKWTKTGCDTRAHYWCGEFFKKKWGGGKIWAAGKKVGKSRYIKVETLKELKKKLQNKENNCLLNFYYFSENDLEKSVIKVDVDKFPIVVKTTSDKYFYYVEKGVDPKKIENNDRIKAILKGDPKKLDSNKELCNIIKEYKGMLRDIYFKESFSFHVAPFVWMKVKGKNEPEMRVFDPNYSNKLLTVDEWLSLFKVSVDNDEWINLEKDDYWITSCIDFLVAPDPDRGDTYFIKDEDCSMLRDDILSDIRTQIQEVNKIIEKGEMDKTH
ncbi:MAG: hypothetical protein HQK49_14500 [Oligoflexia bacterium]|nr:hypothetical protein [Oligoflexia bacterium]